MEGPPRVQLIRQLHAGGIRGPLSIPFDGGLLAWYPELESQEASQKMKTEGMKPHGHSVDVPLEKWLGPQERPRAKPGSLGTTPAKLGPVAQKVLAAYAPSRVESR